MGQLLFGPCVLHNHMGCGVGDVAWDDVLGLWRPEQGQRSRRMEHRREDMGTLS